MSGPSTGLTAVFLTFHFAGGIIGLPLVVFSIIASRQISRHPTLLNFCATWFFSSLVYTLLLYAGKQRDPHPPFGLCLAQASMATGVFPMTSVAGVALVAHIWHGLGPSRPWSQFGLASHDIQTARLTSLLLAPYIVFMTLTIAAAAIGHQQPDRITSHEALFYCTIDSSLFNVFVPVFTIVAMAFILLFEGLICMKIYRNAYIRVGLDRFGFRLFLVRLAGFAIYAIIALIVAALLLSNSSEIAPYILQASLPLSVFIFIGTQKEVLSIWNRWFPRFGRDEKHHQDGSHYRSRSTTALMVDGRPPTPSFVLETFRLQDIDKNTPDSKAEIYHSKVPTIGIPKRPPRPQQTIESFFTDPTRPLPAHTEPQKFEAKPPKPLLQQPAVSSRPQEPVRPYDVQFPSEPSRAPINPSHGFSAQDPNFQASGVDQEQANIIATQKQTISRLLEEAGYMNKALDRLKNIEQSFHKAQNALTTERRTASQLRGYVNQLEYDLQAQQNILNDRIVQNKTLEDNCKYLEEKAEKLDKLTKSLDNALQDSLNKEMEWMKKYEELKSEHTVILAEKQKLEEENSLLMDYFVSHDSPVDWSMPGGANSRQNAFPPSLKQKMRQRASTPMPRPFSRSASLRKTRRQTDAAAAQNPVTTTTKAKDVQNAPRTEFNVDSLDRLRPKLLKLSGKMELSEKVMGLEELVREQAAVIEELEAVVDDDRRERIRRHLETSTESWSIPGSISSSMIANSSSFLFDRDSRIPEAENRTRLPQLH